MARLAKLTGDAMQAGISPSLPNEEGLFWRDSINAVFAEKSIQPALGQDLLIVGQGKRPTDLLTTRVDQVPSLFVAAEDSIIKWTDQNGAIEVGYGYSSEGIWAMEAWGSHVVATNGNDPVQYWQGGLFADLEGCPYTAEHVVRRSPFMVVLNTNVSGTHLAWCDEDNVNEWEARPDTMAGDLYIRDAASDIIAALPMGDEIVFYTADSVHRLSFIGAPYVFGERKLTEGVGPVGKHAVCEVGRSHYGLSSKGLFLTNGLEYKFIDKDFVHDWVYDNISADEDVLSRACVYNDEVEELVFFFFPSKDSQCNDRCIAYSYRYGNFQPMSVRREAAENVSAFPYGLTADRYGNVFLQQTKSLLTNQNIEGLRLDGVGGVRYGFGSGPFGGGPFGGALGIVNANECPVTLPNGDATVVVTDNQKGKTTRLSALASPNEMIFVESKDFDFGSQGVKSLDTIKFMLESHTRGLGGDTETDVGTINFYVGGRNSSREEHVWQGPYEISQSDIDCLNMEAVFFRIRLTATAPKERWKLNSITMNGSVVSKEAPQCQTVQPNSSLLREQSKKSKTGCKVTYEVINLFDLKV